ncbi:hypothetical protein MRB53_041725 [Persea americana]|nr:hypothetical protein MRB53_041725 [Persea americana]
MIALTRIVSATADCGEGFTSLLTSHFYAARIELTALHTLLISALDVFDRPGCWVRLRIVRFRCEHD